MNFRVKNGKKSGTKSIRSDQIYDVTMFTCQIVDYSNGSSSLVTYQNGMNFVHLWRNINEVNHVEKIVAKATPSVPGLFC